MNRIIFDLTFILLNLLFKIKTEGILWEPVSRMSAWRVNSTQFPTYYSDKVICCGGLTVQWNQNGKRFKKTNQSNQSYY